MQRRMTGIIGFGVSLVAVAVVIAPAVAREPVRELTVHLVQARTNSSYAFVRAKFEPGEVVDPWAVRFFDRHGQEVPYFVWDSATWRTAREGREDWGGRYALLNHHPGDAPEALAMRRRRIEAAKQQFPELGAALEEQEQAARRSGDSVCAALYLVRYSVPAFGKELLTLRVFPTRQIEPRIVKRDGDRVTERLSAAAGDLVVENLPDRPIVRWKGRELFRYGGFKIGDKSAGKDGSIAGETFADAKQPFAIEITEGIITRALLRGRTVGRAGAGMDWQCTFWLLPEGSYAALTGFSFENSDGYLGGGLSMARWEMPRQPELVHEPSWENPWWLHRLGDAAVVACHQFTDIPLAIGYANNPFCVSAPGSFHVHHGEQTKGTGDGAMELNWAYELTDKRIYRLFHPRLDNDGSYDFAEITDLRETLLTDGTLTRVPKDAVAKDGTPIWPPERVAALEEALRFVKWRPRVDWLYRQYLVGVGDNAAETETGIRQVLGAAVGWIDRPVDESELAELIVQHSLRHSLWTASARYQQAWMVLPAALERGDRESVRRLLRESSDPIETAADAMSKIRLQIAAGEPAISGSSKNGGEGWLNNPAYAAVDVPVALRFMEHFRLFDLASRPASAHRKALLEWADYSLEVLGGNPIDWEQFRASLRSLWANRIVMLAPLLLHACRETNDEKYARAARVLFEDVLMNQVEKNPHGYFWAWGSEPRRAELFDLNYNVAAIDRGIIDYWSEGPLSIIGREHARRFAAAHARYLAFSGQLLDTLETDSMTAVQSHYPGQIPFAIGQLSLLLYDDFPFYRGLIGDVIRWGAIDDGATLERRAGRRNLYSLKIGSRGAVFWAYGIGRKDVPPSRTAREMKARWVER